MSSQDTRKSGSCREEKSTEQPGVERKHRKRRWGEALPTAAAEDRGGTKRKAGDHSSSLAGFSPAKEKSPATLDDMKTAISPLFFAYM
jgi:hypothetical protein